MIITTTNSIDKASIKEYLGIITSNIVIGTNFVADFFASMTDILGGESWSYQSDLQIMYERAIAGLERKAYTLGADAIVGLHIDFDEISGKGKSMFMVAVSGTAVKIEYNVEVIDRYEVCDKLYKLKLFYNEQILSQEEYEFEKAKILEKYENYIQKELSIKKAAIEAEQHRMELENKRMEEAEKRRELLRKVECCDVKCMTQFPTSFDTYVIETADYSQLPIDNSSSMDENIKIMIKLGAYNEACKYYTDETGLEAKDAIEHVKYLYGNIVSELAEKYL